MLVPHPFADDLSTDKSNANFPYCLETPVFISVLLAARDQCVGGVVVNRLEVLRLQRVSGDTRIAI